MLKIAIVRFNQGDYGGIENQIINFTTNMDSSVFSFILITNKETQFSKKFEKNGSVKILSTSKLVSAAKEMRKIIDIENITIVQSHMLREHYIACLATLRMNVYHIYRVHTYINCSFISNYKKKLYHFLSHLLDWKVDLYLPINKANYDELIDFSKISKKKIKVVHNGVRGLSAEYENKDDFNYYDIVMIANFNYGKGHDIAIKALRELLMVNQKYKLYFIGGEQNNEENELSVTDEMKKLAIEEGVLDNVVFLGFCDNIGKILGDKNIIILPSYSEGTPNCLLESMSIKKTVIASAVGGIPEFIHDGINGFLHENKDYVELANKVVKISKLGLEEIKVINENGYLTWNNDFSLNNLCDTLKRIYLTRGKSYD